MHLEKRLHGLDTLQMLELFLVMQRQIKKLDVYQNKH